MKLFRYIVLTLTGLLIITTSCNNKKTYADYLKEEKRAIDLFIAENNLDILRDFPEDGKFRANQFYKDPGTGVYFNIIDYGDTDAKLQWKESVYIRFKGLTYFKGNDTIRYSNYQSSFPEELIYVGPVSSTTKSSYANVGWAVPLPRIGHKGRVKMIVPFEMGSSYDRTYYHPSYYDLIEYRFDSQW
ncbi:MAG: DUF4827 domain-containing protein [Proteiniphilum sp.]|jgi:hypothetical protein|nr:DUF4827 domain-containing protein [Proteiniphilum sp.]